MISISLIVKVDRNNLIGDSERNCMPREWVEIDQWIKQANRQDMKQFVQLRKQKNGDHPSIVVMWRKTRESIPVRYRPFDGNINCIISSTLAVSELWDTNGELVQIFASIESCFNWIKKQYLESNVNIIGGGQVYQYVLEHNLVDIIHLTRLDAEFVGDVYFPVLWDVWNETSKIDFAHHSFISYEKLLETV